MFLTHKLGMPCAGIASSVAMSWSLRRRMGCSVLALCLALVQLALAADGAPKTRLIVGSELDFPILGEPGWMVLLTLAVVFSALNGGFGPAVLAAAVSLILAAFVIFEPRGLLALAETANLLTLGLIAVVGLSISVMSGGVGSPPCAKASPPRRAIFSALFPRHQCPQAHRRRAARERRTLSADVRTSRGRHIACGIRRRLVTGESKGVRNYRILPR